MIHVVGIGIHAAHSNLEDFTYGIQLISKLATSDNSYISISADISRRNK